MASRTTTTTAEPDSRPLIDRARSAVPGYDAAKAAEAAVKARRDALPREAVDTGDYVPEIVAAAMAGADLAELKIAERAMSTEQAARAFHTEHDALTRAATRLVLDRQHALADGIDAALDVVRAELDAVITEARRVSDALDGIDDAQAAIDAGVTQEWQAWGTLATRYAEVRTAQTVVMAAAARAGDVNAAENARDRDTRAVIDLFGHLRHPEVVVEVTEHHRAGRTRNEVIHNGVVVSGRLPWLDPLPAVALEAALTPGADPWCPTPDELEDARDEYLAAVPGPPPERKVPAHVVRAATAGMHGVDVDLDPR